MNGKILQGDCLDQLKTLETESVDCCITSPPYYGLRDYGVVGQIGIEKTPEDYVAKMVEVFREVRRVLKKEGTLWLNIGDSYWGGGFGASPDDTTEFIKKYPKQSSNRGTQSHETRKMLGALKKNHPVLKSKDLIGIPWRVALGLQADGWYLRQDIIWAKPNPMPESVTDRCTKSHEYVFLLSKSSRYYFDNVSIQEPSVKDWRKSGGSFMNDTGWHRGAHGKPPTKRKHADTNNGANGTGFQNHSGYNKLSNPLVRNKRSVWSVNTKPFSGAHFATFPEDLISPMILAACPIGGVVLDPFMGAGTTAVVSEKLNRKWLGIEINESYIAIAMKRIPNILPM